MLRKLKAKFAGVSPKPTDAPARHSNWTVFGREGRDGSPDIEFRVEHPDAPLEQRELKAAVERALAVVKVLYRAEADRPKLDEAVAKLVALAQVGLVGPRASPLIAGDALRAFESEVTDRESGPVKNAYMRTLGAWAALFGGTTVAVFFFCDCFPNAPFEQVYRYRNIFLVWAGCMAGAWASFASRRVTLAFGDLVALEEDKVEPPLRLLFAGTLTVVLSLVFVTGMADVQIGAYRASALLGSGSIAFLTGAFAGLAEKALPSAVLARAETVIAASKPA